MATRDVVVIGASTGGVEAISTVVAGLPPDFAAALFVVLHTGEHSRLPEILNRIGKLPAAHAVNDERIRRGRIYVAPPGLQTYVHRGRVSVRLGPRENMHRPAIDALFRTAAHYYGARVIGVVLSGALDDGAAGLAAIKEAGGLAIVQDPADARMPDMPAHALERANAEYCLTAAEIPVLLASSVGQEVNDRLSAEVPLESAEEAAVPGEARRSDQLGEPTGITCPECSGALFEIDQGDTVRFRCRVGHAYSEESLVCAQNDAVERALWVALRTLEERVAVMRKLADFARRRGHASLARTFDGKARQVDENVGVIHELLTNGRALEPVTGEGRRSSED